MFINFACVIFSLLNAEAGFVLISFLILKRTVSINLFKKVKIYYNEIFVSVELDFTKINPLSGQAFNLQNPKILTGSLDQKILLPCVWNLFLIVIIRAINVIYLFYNIYVFVNRQPYVPLSNYLF